MLKAITFGMAGLALGLSLTAVAPAAAHITIKPASAFPDAYIEASFNVPHGCDGAATTSIRVTFPEGVLGVKPQLKSGWAITIKTRTLAEPQANQHGHVASEVPDTVEWRGGPLANELYDTFNVLMRVPGGSGPLYFPVVQQCGAQTHEWVQIPASGQDRHQLPDPAPMLMISPARP